jgi:regulator of PEP synthase PpsR (kinase-PPPase family)
MKRTAARRQRTLYVLSDSTGNLARHMITAFLTQFPKDAFTIRWRPFLKEGDALGAVLAEVENAPGIVFHAVVSPAAKRRIERRCQEVAAPCCDLTGRFVEFLAEASGLTPQADEALLHRTDASYHKRISAIEYTLSHDDGLGLDTLADADIILAGVSRTSKSPTSIYLGQLGHKVANVSLAIEVQPPEELLAADADKVVGLLIDPHQLVEIRTHRKGEWKMSTGEYNDLAHVTDELRWSRRLFTKYNWHVLDVTDQAIEETAAKIVGMLGL